MNQLWNIGKFISNILIFIYSQDRHFVTITLVLIDRLIRIHLFIRDDSSFLKGFHIVSLMRFFVKKGKD